jgi:hypothetical protein
MQATGGRWDPAAWPTYFLAQNISNITYTGGYARDHLIAVNEIRSAADEAFIDGLMGRDELNLFIDSGVYNLATEHAAAHGLSMDQALGMAPAEIDGFNDLFDRYVRLVTRWADRAWGFVEIDQGGKDNKIKTRARLEALGLRPIPVYHPFNDGWDYFDYLAERYDRICFGNVVQADVSTRKRLVATAWERRRKYPNLWIHLLGLTPSALTVAFPMNSCDSSTWVSPARWGQVHCWGATQRLWYVGDGFLYDRASDSKSAKGHHKSWALAAYDAGLVGRTMRRMADDQRQELGCDPGGFL